MAGSTLVTTATDSDTLAGLNCSTDEIAKYDGSGWVCATESSGGISYSNLYTVSNTGTNSVSALCLNSSDIVLHGGCDSTAQTNNTLLVNKAVNPTNINAASGWVCQDQSTGTVTTTATCLSQ